MNSKLRSFLLRLSAIAMIFTIVFIGTKALALGNSEGTIVSPIIGEGVDLAKLAGTVLGWLMALLAGLLWIITRLLSFVFRFVGGLMYGFFINNPLDTELAYIRPLWSFLVDFGNLIVIGSFIALALVILFDLDLPVSKDLGKFAGGIVMIALLLNFSLTFTSAFASTIHSIGIGTVYATQSTAGTNLDLTSRSAFNRSVLKTGNSFFEAVNNNFVEKVSCLGTGEVTYSTSEAGKSDTKGMAAICQFHKKDQKGTLNPLTLIAASDGTTEAFVFYLIVIIRELAVLVLLGVGIFVLIKLLKVSIFRLAYLWIVGIFAGPALVAAFSPFDGMKKYFQTWLKWLVVFSTMMIVFVAGFYLSSYIATINLPATGVAYEPLPNPLEEPGTFVAKLVNSMIEIVVPNIMFPIIGLAILFLLGKYLDETYQQHAEKALKAGGKLMNDARSTVGNVARMPGRAATGAFGAAAGGLKNIQNTPSAIGSLKNSTLSKINSGLAAGQRLSGNEIGARSTDARAVKYAGKNAVNKQIMANRNQGLTDFMSGKEFKAKLAETEYLAKINNSDALGRLGANTSAFANEAKKSGVSDNVIRQGQTAAFNLQNDKAPGTLSLKERNKKLEREEAIKANSNFDTEFANTQSELKANALTQKQNAEDNYTRSFNEWSRKNKADMDDIKDKRAEIASPSSTLNASEKAKILATLNTRSAKLQSQKEQLNKEKDDTIADIEKQIIEISKDVSDNSVVTNTVNKKFLSENQDVNARIGKQINTIESRGINNTKAVATRNKEASDQYDRIEGQANAIFEQLKAIDSDNITQNEKKIRRDNLLASSKGVSGQEVRKLAERKLKDFNSNLYGDE
jgi:hypothetical protein